jgi:hypothetical protein
MWLTHLLREISWTSNLKVTTQREYLGEGGGGEFNRVTTIRIFPSALFLILSVIMFFPCSGNHLNIGCVEVEVVTSKLYKTSNCHVHMEYVFGTLWSFLERGGGITFQV